MYRLVKWKLSRVVPCELLCITVDKGDRVTMMNSWFFLLASTFPFSFFSFYVCFREVLVYFVYNSNIKGRKLLTREFHDSWDIRTTDDRWKSPTIQEIPKEKPALIIFSRMRVLDGVVKPDLHGATEERCTRRKRVQFHRVFHPDLFDRIRTLD